jgi:hypothetical protein
MADFARVTLADGTKVLFEDPGADLVSLRTSAPDVDDVEPDVARLETIAHAAGQVSTSLRDRLAPDELTLEIGVGLSGEVGWFFAKSSVEGSLKITVTWKNPNKKGIAEGAG